MTTLKVSSKAPDQTYGTYRSTIWTTVEANAAIIAACLPMLRTLVSHMFPKAFIKSRYGWATSLGNSQTQTNGSGNKIAATRPNPTNLKLSADENGPGPVELDRIRNMPRPTPPPPTESRPYMLNSSGYPLSRITPIAPQTTDQGVKVEKNSSLSTTSMSESHEELKSSPR